MQTEERLLWRSCGEKVPNAEGSREAVMGDIKPTMMSEEESDD